MNPEIRLGFLAGLAAYSIWGFLPLYFKLVGHIPPEHMLAHRVIWSIPVGFGLVLLARRWRELKSVLVRKEVFWLCLSAAVIGMNWGLYIWAVGQNRVMEASLGYYINPLVNVAVGALLLSEKLRRLQWVAVAVATVGVGIETVALGRLPWVALFLCATFASYALIRRKVQVDSRVGFMVEVLFLAPIALLWMLWYTQTGNPIAGRGGWDWLLIAAAGPITAAPLILFALSAKRLKFSTIGMMQYIGPTLQFMLALSFGEVFTALHAVAFACIWVALFLFTFDSVAEDRRGKRAARAAKLV